MKFIVNVIEQFGDSVRCKTYGLDDKLRGVFSFTASNGLRIESRGSPDFDGHCLCLQGNSIRTDAEGFTFSASKIPRVNEAIIEAGGLFTNSTPRDLGLPVLCRTFLLTEDDVVGSGRIAYAIQKLLPGSCCNTEAL